MENMAKYIYCITLETTYNVMSLNSIQFICKAVNNECLFTVMHQRTLHGVWQGQYLCNVISQLDMVNRQCCWLESWLILESDLSRQFHWLVTSRDLTWANITWELRIDLNKFDFKTMLLLSNEKCGKVESSVTISLLWHFQVLLS